jgi:hypothetical protein
LRSRSFREVLLQAINLAPATSAGITLQKLLVLGR